MTDETQGNASQDQPPVAQPAQPQQQVQQPATAPAQQFNPDEFFSRRVQAYVDQQISRVDQALQQRINALASQQPAATALPEVQQETQEPAVQPPAVQQQAVQPPPPQPERKPDDYIAIDIVVDLAGMPDDAPEVAAITEKSKEVRGGELIEFARQQAAAYLVRTAGEIKPKAEPEARIGLATGSGIPIGNNPISEVTDHNELFELYKQRKE